MIKVRVNIDYKLSSSRIGIRIRFTGHPLREEIVENAHVEMEGSVLGA